MNATRRMNVPIRTSPLSACSRSRTYNSRKANSNSLNRSCSSASTGQDGSGKTGLLCSQRRSHAASPVIPAEGKPLFCRGVRIPYAPYEENPANRGVFYSSGRHVPRFRMVQRRAVSQTAASVNAMWEGPGQLVLREIEDRDLSVLFEHSTDRDAIRMAAFTSPDPDDRTTFEQRWARLRSDDSTTNRVVEIDGRVVGHIASFDLEGHREITYWIGREDWGRGIATGALREFLLLEATRPLYARAASDNAASIRVLTKCGFLIVGEGRGFAHGRNEEADEVVLRLDA